MEKSRVFWVNLFFAWLVFLGIDFFFHAGLFKLLWIEDTPAIKTLDELSRLIPVGYLSFLLISWLVAYTFTNIFREKPEASRVTKFAFTWGILFALSNFLGLYSYVTIPIKQLALFNFVYFIEIFSFCYALNGLYFSENKRRVKRIIFLLFFGSIFLGVILQNIIA